MKFLTLFALCALLASCSTAYYGAMEKIGYAKRDILVSRVKKARDSHQEASKEFRSALDEFIAVSDYRGGDLEKKYGKLNGAYENSEAQAKEVRERNDAVESVGKALFKEWDREIGEFENPLFAANSRTQRAAALRRFDSLTAAARNAESRLDPVLRQFRDHVLYLKHNLNAQAVSALQGQVAKTEIDVSRLIREMEKAIAEADAFIREMK